MPNNQDEFEVVKEVTVKKTYKRRKKKVKQVTRVALVVDRSGSMDSILEAARGGLKEQINAIKANADKSDETYVTLISFDGEIITHFDGQDAKNLNVDPSRIIIPRGSTAMNDAVMKAINLLESTEKTDGTGYLVVVISDGYENASKTPKGQLSNRIKELEAQGNWTFTFMLANQDIHTFSKDMGINIGNSYAFAATNTGTAKGFTTMANATATYMQDRSFGLLRKDSFYSDVDATLGEAQKNVQGNMSVSMGGTWSKTTSALKVDANPTIKGVQADIFSFNKESEDKKEDGK